MTSSVNVISVSMNIFNFLKFFNPNCLEIAVYDRLENRKDQCFLNIFLLIRDTRELHCCNVAATETP